MTAPTARAELAAAVRAVNAAFAQLPADVQDQLDVTYDPLDAEVNAAMLADDRNRALAAIRAWRGYWLDVIARADR